MKPSILVVDRFYQQWSLWIGSLVLLLLRLIVGIGFLHTGYGKLTNLGHTTQMFAGMGIPAPHLNAILAACAEFFGGICLLVGLLARWTAIPLIVTMIVALITTEKANAAKIFSDPSKFLWAKPTPFLIVALVVFALGPGVFSVDGVVRWVLRRKHAKAAPLAPLAPDASGH